MLLGVLQWMFKALKNCLNGVLKVFEVIRGYFKGVSRLLPVCFKDILNKFGRVF